MDILTPLKGKYSEKCAFLKIGNHMACYGDKTAAMEAFARVLWGLTPFWHGGGSDTDFEKIYLKGIISGTNPESSEYWGNCNDFDQRFVEMASLAYALLLAPEKIWKPMSKKEKENFAGWLYQINDLYVPESNWLFFRVLVNIALKKCGMKYNGEKLLQDLDYIDRLYLGDGWYADGFPSEKIPHNGQRDYYNPFALHFYGLIYAKIMGDERGEKFKERAVEFAGEFIYWFSDSGAVIWGGIRDTEQMKKIDDTQVYYRGIDPTPIRDFIMTGYNTATRIGNAICLPGDVVFDSGGGVLFIPSHLVAEVVGGAAKTQVKDLFGFEMISLNKFTTAQIDKNTWTKEMLDLLMEFIKTDDRALSYRDLDWSEEYDLAINGDPNDTQSAL